jgi:hypothetical protein
MGQKLGLLVLLAVSAWLGGCDSPQLGKEPITTPDGAAGNPVSWHTSTVSLTADDFRIVADGQTYRGTAGIDVESDPGSGTYTTLELTWTERSREMRYYIYFSANATGWWSSEMRTYNGQTGLGDWLYYRGTFFQSPLGAAFHGDVDLTNAADDPYRGELHLHGVALSTTLAGT